MKLSIIVSTLLLAIATTLPAWANQAHHPQSNEQATVQSSTAVVQEKIDSCIATMEDLRLKMEMAPNQKERTALMHKHMQEMKNGMKLMDMGDKEMMGQKMMGNDKMGGAQGGMNKTMMESKMQMMMEMMHGMMSQQEMMMEKK